MCNRIMPSVWGKNNGMPASYVTKQNQSLAVYAEYLTQQERISLGLQTIDRSSGGTSITSDSIVTAATQGGVIATSTGITEQLIQDVIAEVPPRPPAPGPPPYVPGPGQASWANILRAQTVSTSTVQVDTLGVTTDSQGNVYICGRYNTSNGATNIPLFDYTSTSGNTINLNTSSIPPITATSFGTCLVIAKYNKDGIAQWAVNLTNTTGIGGSGASLVADGSGNIYVITTFLRTSALNIFHMSGGTRSLYGTIGTSTTTDLILLKYDTNGTAQSVSVCTSSTNAGNNETLSSPGRYIAYHSSGVIAFTFFVPATANNQPVAIFNGTTPATPGGAITFGAAAVSITNDTNCNQFGIIVKMNSSNLTVTHTTKITSIRIFGTSPATIKMSSIMFDISGNIICSGEQSVSTTAFNGYATNVYIGTAPPSTPTSLWGTYSNSLASNITDVFIVKYDTNLVPLAFTSIDDFNFTGTGSSDISYYLTSDSSRNIYVLTGGQLNSSYTRSIRTFNNVTSGTINTNIFGTLVGPVSTNRNAMILVKYTPTLSLVNNSRCVTTIPYNNTLSGTGTSTGVLTIDNNNNIYVGINYFNRFLINNASLAPGGGVNIPVTSYASTTNVSPFLANTIYNNTMLVKYNSDLEAQWTTTLNPGINLACNALDICYDSATNSVYVVGSFDNRSGGLNINNYNNISAGNVNTTFYAILPQSGVTVQDSAVRSGFIVRYAP